MIEEFFYSINPNDMVLGLLFIIIFALINFVLGRTILKQNNATKNIISLAVSILAIYGINFMNLDMSRFFYNFGISDIILYNVVPILSLCLIIFLSIRKNKEGRKTFSVRLFLIIIGIILILASLFEIVYETVKILIIGIAFIIFSILLFLIKLFKKKDDSKKDPIKDPDKKDLNQTPNKKNIDQNGSTQEGIRYLIELSRRFKAWALTQPSPKRSGTWAMFIYWLKQNRIGRDEKEICQRIGVTKRDFVEIFNKYGKV